MVTRKLGCYVGMLFVLLSFWATAPIATAGKYQAIGRFETSSRTHLKDATALELAYQAAIDDARQADPDEIVYNLAALAPQSTGLRWREVDGASQVLLVTWTDWNGYLGQQGQSMEMGVDVWVTPFPQLRDFASDCDLEGASLELRLAQRLGMPPETSNSYVVEMWVDPSDVFRPSPDPEVTDRQSELDYPRSAEFVKVEQSHKTWIDTLISQSYGPDGYPWTRLGYTYDWADKTNPVGFSEFVVRQGASVEIEAVYSTAEYAELGNYHLKHLCESFLEYAEQARQDWKIPAMAIGVVYRDQILCASAFGTRGVDDNTPVTVDTLFQIGSISKSFTALLTAIMVDHGLLNWQDRVKDLYPEFAFQQSTVTEAFLLQDTMAQHSGLPGYAVTALALFGVPESVLIAAHRYIEASGVFRQDYAYQNGLLALAGEICARVSGKTYEQSVEDEIFAPLGMDRSHVTVDDFLAEPNRALTHVYKNLYLPQGVQEIRPEGVVPYYFADQVRPAGSLSSTLTDMLKYLRMQIAEGQLDGQRIVSEENLAVIHTPQTMISSGIPALYYCMGWVKSHQESAIIFWHNGDTMVSHACIGFAPEHELGIVVLSNVGGQSLPDVLMRQFFNQALQQTPKDYVAEEFAKQISIQPEPFNPPQSATPAREISVYAGKYHNPACGVATVTVQGDGLTIKLDQGALVLNLKHWSGDDFYISDDLKTIMLDEEGGLVRFEFGEQDSASGLNFDLLGTSGLTHFERVETWPADTAFLGAY